MPYDCEVIVVGGGPVGVLALTLLGHAGIRAVGVEREPEMWSQARAVHFDGETMRSLQAIGLAEDVAARSKPMCDFRMENEDGETLITQPTGQVGPQAWHDEVLFHQPEIDALLRAEVTRLSDVELRCGVTLTGVEQDDDGVRCHVRTQDGADEILTARYVIACDGAQSTVRRTLGVTCENLGTDDPWLVVDGRLAGTAPIDGDMVFLGRHTRPALWVNLPRDHVRMEFKLMPGDDREEIVTDEAIARISRGVLTPETFTPERKAIYTFRARVATDWRIGNVFLAGDAAHQAPPLFGQGLCAGLRDVTNLIWKLRLVSLGRAADDLLDTYESERRPHAHYWVEKAATMAHLVQATDPETAAQRDAFIRVNPAASRPPIPPLGPGVHLATDPRAGHLSPQPVLPDGRRLDDLVGRRFLLAARPELLAGLPPAVRRRIDDDAEIVALTAPEETDELLASAQAPAVIVRPDHYVLGTAHDVPSLESLLEALPTWDRAAARTTSGAALSQGG
ncbi:bifunctional 3-(3-hydroxy-phenyl)propionate/3-hydroxycinnamic acid hydroxylase [Streptomyces scabiei]|uniref:bifunctional 3-(3-hydroxy-phenyl)propionate/3-hydroxycinnamic acid hydroxylase n=1 Tax=Streptomyces scabiei TaxID=1930 RepID=UPI0006916B5D|nr:bifunctional 3-(3-hydroxy-phenyl)propionate/3-hydroxycinnamic acid hydroxylase [Streptomyces scabiei]